MNLHPAYQPHQPQHHQQLSHHQKLPQSHNTTQQAYNPVPVQYVGSDVLSKFKLRFIPSDDHTKNLLSALGKKLFLDLTLKKSKTWRSVLEYLCTKWSDIPNLLTRLQLYYVDNTGNIIGNLIYNLNLPVVDSLYQHPSMSQLAAPVNELGPVFPLFYMLIPEDLPQYPEPPLPEPMYEEHQNDSHNHDMHVNMDMDMGKHSHSIMLDHNGHHEPDSFSAYHNSHSLLEPSFHHKKDALSSGIDHFSRFPDASPSLLGGVGDSCIDNMLANSSMLMGAHNHSVGTHDFSRLLKNLASNTKEAASSSYVPPKEENVVKEEREGTPSGKLKHSFSHIFETEDGFPKLDLDNSSKESSPVSVTDAKGIEGTKENEFKRKFTEESPSTNAEGSAKLSEEPLKKKKKTKLKQKPNPKLNPLRFLSTGTTVPLTTKPVNEEKSFMAKLSRVGRSRPELRRINPTFVQPL